MKTTLKLIIIFCLLGQFQTAEAQLLKRLKKRVENRIERKIEQKVEQKVDETVDNQIDSIGKKKKPKTDESKSSNTTSALSKYMFTDEAVVKVTTYKDKRDYKMSYLLNPEESYVAIKVDMSEYSEEEMAGESIIVMHNGNAHIFVETSGMKIQMSSGQMGGKQSNPTEEMANMITQKLKKPDKPKPF